MTYTDKDIEVAADVLIESDIRYWTSDAYMDDNGSLVLTEDDEDASPVTISPIDLLDWLASDGPAKLIGQIGAQYQKAAVADLIAHNWEDLDYDVETGDLIVQQIALGEVRYG